MSRKPTSLSDVLVKKAAAMPTAVEASEAEVKTLTVRLKPIVHDQLRELAFTARRSQHDLIMQALNLLFELNGKPPIAPVAHS